MDISTLMGSQWLGHGRKAEFLVGLICAIYSVFILIRPGDSQALRMDVGWGIARLVAIPFGATSACIISGVVLNCAGLQFSWWLRLAGVLLSSYMMTWLIYRFCVAGAPLTWGSACAVGFLILNVTATGSVWANLPTPGAPGAR